MIVVQLARTDGATEILEAERGETEDNDACDDQRREERDICAPPISRRGSTLPPPLCYLMLTGAKHAIERAGPYVSF